MSINFKASFISPMQILERRPNNTWHKKEAAFIELNPLDKKDLDVLFGALKLWHPSTFTSAIFTDAYMQANWEESSNKAYKFYALSEPMDDYKTPQIDKILGLAEVENCSPEIEFLHYLQVKPCYQWDYFLSKYKHIGTAILRSIEKYFSPKTILLDPEENAIPFYKKNGYSNVEHSSKMLLRSKL